MKCDFCNNRADYRSSGGHIHWCEDCYNSMADDLDYVIEIIDDFDYDEFDDECEDDQDHKIRNYYDSMREEFDPSYDER